MSLSRIHRTATALAVAALALATLPAQAQSNLKIGVIDVERIVTESATGKATLAKLEDYGKEQQAKLQAKKDSVDQLRSRIAEGSLSLAEDKLNELKKELESRSIELRRAGDDAQREFNQRQQEALGEIERRVMPVIKKVGEEGGYTMIFRKFDSGLVYATEDVDLTAVVIQRLDAAQGAEAKPSGSR